MATNIVDIQLPPSITTHNTEEIELDYVDHVTVKPATIRGSDLNDKIADVDDTLLTVELCTDLNDMFEDKMSQGSILIIALAGAIRRARCAQLTTRSTNTKNDVVNSSYSTYIDHLQGLYERAVRWVSYLHKCILYIRRTMLPNTERYSRNALKNLNASLERKIPEISAIPDSEPEEAYVRIRKPVGRPRIYVTDSESESGKEQAGAIGTAIGMLIDDVKVILQLHGADAGVALLQGNGSHPVNFFPAADAATGKQQTLPTQVRNTLEKFARHVISMAADARTGELRDMMKAASKLLESDDARIKQNKTATKPKLPLPIPVMPTMSPPRSPDPMLVPVHVEGVDYERALPPVFNLRAPGQYHDTALTPSEIAFDTTGIATLLELDENALDALNLGEDNQFGAFETPENLVPHAAHAPQAHPSPPVSPTGGNDIDGPLDVGDLSEGALRPGKIMNEYAV